MPAHSFPSKTQGKEQKRRSDQNGFEKLQAAVAQDRPDAPQEDFIQPLKFGHLTSRDRVRETFARLQFTGSNDLRARADLPSEIEICKGDKIIDRQQQDHQYAEEIRQLLP